MKGNDLQFSLDAGRFVVEHLGLAPDPRQDELLRRGLKRAMLNCARQWGESSITAALAVHRAVHEPESLTVVLSPRGRQSGEFLRKAGGFVSKLGMKARGDRDFAAVSQWIADYGTARTEGPCAGSQKCR